jgi:hypothetical protein
MNEDQRQSIPASERQPEVAERSLGSVLLNDLNQIAVNGALPVASYLLGKAHGKGDPKPPAQPPKEGEGK